MEIGIPRSVQWSVVKRHIAEAPDCTHLLLDTWKNSGLKGTYTIWKEIHLLTLEVLPNGQEPDETISVCWHWWVPFWGPWESHCPGPTPALSTHPWGLCCLRATHSSCPLQPTPTCQFSLRSSLPCKLSLSFTPPAPSPSACTHSSPSQPEKATRWQQLTQDDLTQDQEK